MDNVIIPYTDDGDSSDNEPSDSSSDEEHSQLLSNNVGVLYNQFNVKDTKFMNMESAEEYQIKRNELFTPELRKLRILVDSKNVDHSSDHSTSNYTIHFDGDNQSNSTSGYGAFDNVIGFRLIKGILPNSIYQVNNNNKNIIVQLSGGSDVSVDLTPGSYTFNELGDHLVVTLNAHGSLSGFSITKDEIKYKYTITNSTDFLIKWKTSSGAAWRLFGFLNIDDTSDTGSKQSANVVQQNIQFVDLVIPEIPYIACKRNSSGKNIIDRIPLNESSGSMIAYSSDINPNNYFHPINLNKLTIQLYEDTSDTLYDCQNNDNSFEFEITMLNHLA